MNRLGRKVMEIARGWKVWSARMVCERLEGCGSESGIAVKLDEMADDGVLHRKDQAEGPTIYYHNRRHHAKD